MQRPISEHVYGRVVQVIPPEQRHEFPIGDDLDEFAGDRYIIVLQAEAPDLLNRWLIYLHPFRKIVAPVIVTERTNVREGDIVNLDADLRAPAGELAQDAVYTAEEVTR